MSVRLITNQGGRGGARGMLPQGNFLILGALRSFLRPFFGQNATRISLPVVSVARRMNQADRNDRLA